MTYDEVISHLDALQMHKIKLGLDAMESFLARVGRPEKSLSFVHVAGTNGKGSVCAALCEILGKAGYRVGVFTSPHLSCVRERFRIGSEYIGEEVFARLGSEIVRVLGKDQITYFEFTTALALLWFAEVKVDLVILETGMGGRLDATNVVVPLVSVITSISMDHEIYLGDTLKKIAGEKAGIIKPAIPVVSGAKAREAADVIMEKCREVGSPLYRLGQEFDYTLTDQETWAWHDNGSLGKRSFSGLQSSRQSLAQQDNDSLAVATILLLQQQGFGIDESHLREGLAKVKWPGRMEYFELNHAYNGEANPHRKKLRYLLDGAHNPDGVNNLAKTLQERFTYRRLIVLWGAMADKDLTATLGVIAPLADHLVLTQPYGERAAKPEQLAATLPQSLQNKAFLIADVAQALAKTQEVAEAEDLILVAGSLYLLGAIRQSLLGELA